ncbi:MAG: HAD-IIIA family hydrolase [Deltaproteobacteria bacterium]|nr:HAD-IIIA family hydrolase [Deltaproteobacteria bacterium]
MEKAARVKGLVLDVDGTLTDGTIWIGPRGEEFKAFNVHDGFGLKKLKQAGLLVAIISGRDSKAVTRRAKELGISFVYQGVKDKVQVFEEMASTSRTSPADWAFVGDDVPDIPLLEKVGLAVAVADCASDLNQRVHYKTRNPGGRGAVREVCELILKARSMWPY